jgi:hypothetical protein
MKYDFDFGYAELADSACDSLCEAISDLLPALEPAYLDEGEAGFVFRASEHACCMQASHREIIGAAIANGCKLIRKRSSDGLQLLGWHSAK